MRKVLDNVSQNLHGHAVKKMLIYPIIVQNHMRKCTAFGINECSKILMKELLLYMKKRLLTILCIGSLAFPYFSTPALAESVPVKTGPSEVRVDVDKTDASAAAEDADKTDASVAVEDADKTDASAAAEDADKTDTTDEEEPGKKDDIENTDDPGSIDDNEDGELSSEGTLARPEGFSEEETGTGELEEYVEAEGDKIDGNEVVKYIYRSLRDYFGFNHAAACAVIANARHESNFNYTVVGDGGTSYGIFQWHAGRWNSLKTWCTENGYDWQNADGQMAYFRHELETGYSDVLNYLQNVEDSDVGAFDGAYYMCVHFEKPADTYGQANSRGKEAIEFFGMEELRDSYRANIAENDDSKGLWDLSNY